MQKEDKRKEKENEKRERKGGVRWAREKEVKGEGVEGHEHLPQTHTK